MKVLSFDIVSTVPAIPPVKAPRLLSCMIFIAIIGGAACQGKGSTETSARVEAAPSSLTYSVIYYGNGNTGGVAPVDNTKYSTGAQVAVSTNSTGLVKAGFTFAGWNTQPNGSGVTYQFGNSLLVGGANVTLYARWTNSVTYTISYLGNGQTSGAPPTDVNNYLSGDNAIIRGNLSNLARTGYTFVGWNTQANGLGNSYAGGVAYTVSASNIALYAIWSALPTYSVTYSSNSSTSGTAPIDSNSYLSGANVVVLGNTGGLIKSGYGFDGWNTLANGTGTQYSPGANFSIPASNITLYAKWSTGYSITYSGNGQTSGSPPVDSGFYLQGQQVTTPGNIGTLVKTGFSIASWNSQANGMGVEYYGTIPFTMGASNATLYAKWLTRHDWDWIASSASGMKLVAVVENGQIFTSTDAGLTWTPRESNRLWRAVTSSSDGTRLAATAINGNLYVSADSGVSWSPRDSSRVWWGICNSADGSILAATVSAGQIYISTNFGSTWTARGPNGKVYRHVACSSDGSKMVAITSGNELFTSADFGVTWTARTPTRQWSGLCTSADGTRVAAAVYNGQIYISTDSGVTWTPQAFSTNWSSLACSQDGAKLAAADQSGYIYFSNDFGTTWTNSNAYTTGDTIIAASGDMTKIATVTYSSYVRTSNDFGTTWMNRY